MSSAIISPCGTYRYELRRRIPCALRWVQPALFILFNPSTANAEKDDQTVRKGMGFCKEWFCTDMIFWNLYAFRSRNPKALKTAADPIGPENDTHLRRIMKEHMDGRIILAWGNMVGPQMQQRVAQVASVLREFNKQVEAIKLNDNGSPTHPVMIGYKNEPVPVDLDKLVKAYRK